MATADTIVKVVMNSREMHALYPFRSDIQCGCANAGLRVQKGKRLRKFFVQGFRSKRAILVPPKRSAINVGRILESSACRELRPNVRANRP